jgi:peptidyl-tRNA hydrolase
MPSVIFNGATISFDAPVDLYIIRGKLVIDTASYTVDSKPVTKKKVKKSEANRAPTGLTDFIRNSNLRFGKKLLVKANSKKSIYGVYNKFGYRASIQETGKPNEYMVTCTR